MIPCQFDTKKYKPSITRLMIYAATPPPCPPKSRIPKNKVVSSVDQLFSNGRKTAYTKGTKKTYDFKAFF